MIFLALWLACAVIVVGGLLWLAPRIPVEDAPPDGGQQDGEDGFFAGPYDTEETHTGRPADSPEGSDTALTGETPGDAGRSNIVRRSASTPVPNHAPRRGGDSDGSDAGRPLDHTGECTGAWRYIRERHVVYCSACLAEHPATSERRLAAIDENLSGVWLLALTRAGAAQLERERTA